MKNINKTIHISSIISIFILGASLSCCLAAQPASNIPYRETSQPDKSAALPGTSARRPLPVYLSELSNLNDYALFANSGWDGNWYVGFNVCWMEEIPAPPAGTYVRAFIGAKIGRMKTRPAANKPVWEKEPIPGSIYISLNSTPSWKQANSYFLVDTRDLPLEGDAENALEGVGESRWFWTEVPVSAINLKGSSFLALWSPTEYFVSTASSPILAGGWGSNKVNSWLNNDVRGYPPLNPKNALKTAISAFEPAIAVKLIPADTVQDITVKIVQIADGRLKTPNKTFIAAVYGEEIEKTWLETLDAGGSWKKHGRYIYTPPFSFTLKPETLPEGKMKVRVTASDVWGNTGSSDAVEIEISKQKK